MVSIDKVNANPLGNTRYTADKREIAGLLLVTGFAAIIQPLVGVTSTINSGEDGSTPTIGLSFAGIFGGLCVLFVGVISTAIGYVELVHDFQHKYLRYATAFSFLTMQTAFIPYISGMVGVGNQIVNGPSFIMGVSSYGHTQMDNNFIGSMGILAIFAYGFGFLGAVSFLQFSLYAYQSGKPQDRNASYYRGRAGFYSFILFVAGVSQFLLGAYTLARFGSNLTAAPVQVAFYVVPYPAIAIVVGLLQIINASWAFVRTFYPHSNSDNYSLQASIAFGWLTQLVLQIVTQVGVLPAAAAGLAPVITAFAFGLNLMPAWLEYKARSVAETIDPGYYGLDTSEGSSEEEEMEPVDQV